MQYRLEVVCSGRVDMLTWNAPARRFCDGVRWDVGCGGVFSTLSTALIPLDWPWPQANFARDSARASELHSWNAASL